MHEKYKKIKIEKPIISINDFDTFPKDFKDLIKKERYTVQNYNWYLKKIDELEIISNPYESIHSIEEFKNNNIDILNAFNNLVDKSIVLLNDYYFALYHLGRFTQNEIFNIKKNGMIFPTKELLINKIRDLELCKSDEMKLISHIQNLTSLKAERCIYFKLGNYNINNDIYRNNMKKFLQHWGGETIYDLFENDPKLEYLDKYLIKISTPQIILSIIQLRYIPDRDRIVNKMIRDIFSLDKFDDTIIIYRDDVVKVIDAIPFDLEETLQVKY